MVTVGSCLSSRAGEINQRLLQCLDVLERGTWYRGSKIPGKSVAGLQAHGLYCGEDAGTA